MNAAEFDADLVVDARDCILGRVASEVAQRAIDGETVAVVNAEDAVITGREEDTIEKYRTRTELTSDRGPAYPKRPDGILKRSVRGMVPTEKKSGREALSNVRAYVGNPYDEDGDVIEGTSLDRLSSLKFIALGDLSEHLGANITW